jgi:hypothetical protein
MSMREPTVQFTFDVRRRNLTDTLNGGPGSHAPAGFVLALLLILGGLVFVGLDAELRLRIVGAVVRAAGLHGAWLILLVGAVLVYRRLRGRQQAEARGELLIKEGGDDR